LPDALIAEEFDPRIFKGFCHTLDGPALRLHVATLDRSNGPPMYASHFGEAVDAEAKHGPGSSELGWGYRACWGLSGGNPTCNRATPLGLNLRHLGSPPFGLKPFET
jgi:hypothetical protein